MKKRKFIRVLSMAVLLLLVFTSCAKADRDSSYNNSSKYDDAGERGVAQEQKSSGSSLGAPMGSLDGDLDYADDSGTDTSSLNNSNQNTQDKIIKYVDMDVETLDFDELVSNINQQIKSLNGYVEKSRITGNSYYDSHSRRFAEIIARIPKDHLDDFVNTVNEKANVISSNEYSENVTLKYYDIESHKKALEIEQERLFELIEEADNLENIITLESRLSNIRYQLQNYGTQLRTYDNLVDYSTVTLNLYEVERITPVEEEKTVWVRIKTGFGNTIYNITEGLKDFVVWFVVNLPYLIIWAAIITLGIFITKRIIRKGRNKQIQSSSSAHNNEAINYQNHQNNIGNPQKPGNQEEQKK